jgi:hypothetical protein
MSVFVYSNTAPHQMYQVAAPRTKNKKFRGAILGSANPGLGLPMENPGYGVSLG